MSRKNPISKSFKFAFDGIKTAIKNEPNFRVQLILGTTAAVSAYFLNFSSLEWLILVLTIFLVVILELINTVFEALVDLVSPEIAPQARIAKDVSAAAVLSAAFFSVIVGLVLFLPKLLPIFTK